MVALRWQKQVNVWSGSAWSTEEFQAQQDYVEAHHTLPPYPLSVFHDRVSVLELTL